MSFFSNFSVLLIKLKHNQTNLIWIECLPTANNTFDQLCINYSNERVQNFFVHRMLLKEKEYYNSQDLKIPFVPFLDNSIVIGKYDQS